MLVRLSLIMLLVCSFVGRARAECNCVAVAGDVAAGIAAEVAKADGLYARGDYNGALAIYARVYASAKEPVLLYAQGMAQWQLGANAKAKELLNAYIAAGGALTYKDRAEASLAGIGAGVGATLATAKNLGGGLVGDLGGGVRGGVEGGVGAGADVVGGVRGEVQAKTKVGKKAGIILGVIAIAAIGAVGIHSIAAGVSSDISLDPKFDLGMGIAGVSVGISAIYVGGLTAATVAAPRCVAGPMMLHGGGGVAAAMRF